MNERGTSIERGVVKSVTDAGYRVASFTRDGIVTPPLPALPGTTYMVGSWVYYFMFDDGHGLILAGF